MVTLLKNAGKLLDTFEENHEPTLKEIKDLIKEMEKPWKIKIKIRIENIDSNINNEVKVINEFDDWKNANVEWLTNPE